MNAPDADMPEYGAYDAAYLHDDAVPDTLLPVFRHMAQELFPELSDKMLMLRHFVDEVDPRDGAPVMDKPHQRVIGTVRTAFRGLPFDSGVQPYMLYLWQRVTDAFDAATPAARARIEEWLRNADLLELLTTPRPIRVERARHIEVWGRRLDD